MEKHSPEPWRVLFERHGENCEDWWIWDEEDVVLAHLYGFADIDDSVPIPVEANARVMAAGPKLLAACEALVGIAQTYLNTIGRPSDWLIGEIEKARRAIAAARGEEAQDATK